MLLSVLSMILYSVQADMHGKSNRLLYSNGANVRYFAPGKYPLPQHLDPGNNKINPWSFQVGKRNLEFFKRKSRKSVLNDGEIIYYKPGDKAPPFTIWDLNKTLVYPSQTFENSSILVHVFDPNSGFLKCMWTSNEGLKPIVKSTVLNATHFIFIPKSAGIQDIYGAVWMRDRIVEAIRRETTL